MQEFNYNKVRRKIDFEQDYFLFDSSLPNMHYSQVGE